MRKRRRTAVSPSLSFLVLLCVLLPLRGGRAQQMAEQAGSAAPETGVIAGVVTAQETGVALAEVRVSVLGTNLAATADHEGKFSIAQVPRGTYRLQARLIGYSVAEVADIVVGAGQTVNASIRLQPLPVALQEVVVVGYGTQVRRDVTGSVASVSSEDVHAVPKVNAIEAIKGRVAGVDIVTTGNNPGDGISIRVRGTRSLTASNDPLYVLDGIPMAGGIGDLNPNDIESIEVLKDASATAIYGARGASGVVLIQTKQGKNGKTTITYDTHAGAQQALRRMPMMNGPQWAQFKRDAARNSKTGYQCPAAVAACAHGDSVLFWPVDVQAIADGRWTDWQDLVLREGTQLSNEVRVTGGDEKTPLALSGGQPEQTGIIKGKDFVPRAARLNFDYHPRSPYRRGQFWGAQTQAQQGSPANATLEQQRTLAYTLDNILTYKRSLGLAHRVDATLVYSIQTQHTEDQVTPVIGLPYEQGEYFDLGSAARVDAPSSYVSQWALASVMARVNYAFKDRYLFTLTSRDDCSSRLAPGHKCQIFPSAAFAWRLSEEDFIQRTGLFSDLKLRLSYGRTGNTAINPYQTEGSLSRTIYSFNDLPAVGYRPGSFPNDSLSWERTSQLDVGLEFTGRGGRISGSVDVYRAATSDLLMNRQLAGINGRSSVLQNVGSTLNSGVVVALSPQIARVVNGHVWTMYFNCTLYR